MQYIWMYPADSVAFNTFGRLCLGSIRLFSVFINDKYPYLNNADTIQTDYKLL